MLLSFIIPTYNPDPKIFKKCLKSLDEQSLKEWEAVVVFDGTNDEAENILKETLSHVKYKKIVLPHCGAQKARNEGAKHAKGDIYCFWDCDCIIEPGTAKAWMDIFKANKDIGFIYSGYRFLNEQGGIASEPFDPWLLRVRNYISACFPVRKEFYPGWTESLESLQDWDFWLSVVERGGKGKFLPGYAFQTSYPTAKSISGQGCAPEVWLERMAAVKKLHNIPDNDICVSSLENKVEGIRLAKLIGANYEDFPCDKPNLYKTVIQYGFALNSKSTRHHSEIFANPRQRRILFWTAEDIAEINNTIPLKALNHHSILLNGASTQYCEDLEAHKVLARAGFIATVLPAPLVNTDDIKPMPDNPQFMIDISGHFSSRISVLEKSLPEVKFKIKGGVDKIEDFTGMIAFDTEHTISSTMKRMLITGRHIISNVQQPFCGYVDDGQEDDKFLNQMVSKIRGIIIRGQPNTAAAGYYRGLYSPDKLKNILGTEVVK